MVLFFVFAGAIVVASLLILTPYLFKRSAVKNVDIEQQNLEITRQRLSQLSADSASDEAREELEAAFLDDLKAPDYNLPHSQSTNLKTAVALLIVIPLAAFALYGVLGNSEWQNQIALPTPEQIQQDPGASLDVLLNRLEQTLEQQPENADGWALAGRTYMALGRFAEAESAYATVHRLVGDDPDILTAWSDASLLVNGNQYTKEIAARLERALELDPSQINALWIAGMGARSIGDNQKSLGYLKRLAPLLTNQPEALTQINQVITELEGAAPPSVATADPTETKDQPDSIATISVTVELDPKLETMTNPSDSVFVFARSIGGPPFPLAAARLSVSDLPAEVVLDDSLAMIEGRNLSSTERVLVAARISKDGKPTASPGDLESDPYETPTRNGPVVSLSINRIVD